MDLQGVERIAVISDIHANARALEVALRHLADISPDVVLVLGDVLTYGCEPQKVLDLLRSMRESFCAHFVLGNHDQMYLDLEAGVRSVGILDGPLRDSIEWTINKVGTGWVGEVDWHDEVRFGAVLFSHANPFGPGDWTYLNSAEMAHRAIRQLETRGFTLGVFGHTHRQRIAQRGQDLPELQQTEGAYGLAPGSTAVVTLGSIGQPRDALLWGSMGVVTASMGRSRSISLEFVPVEYDVNAHVASIQNTALPQSTKAWLCRFFR